MATRAAICRTPSTLLTSPCTQAASAKRILNRIAGDNNHARFSGEQARVCPSAHFESFMKEIINASIIH